MTKEPRNTSARLKNTKRHVTDLMSCHRLAHMNCHLIDEHKYPQSSLESLHIKCYDKKQHATFGHQTDARA